LFYLRQSFFLITSSFIFFSNKQPFVLAISANESNRILGGIPSLLSSNPDIVVPNKEFLRFAERWLSDGKADYNHYNNVSMNNYLLSVPHSVNSKTNTEVKIVQKWNGVRPDVRFVYSYFLAYLVDKGNEPHYSDNNNWIEYRKTKR
jgi:hypothetical protein